MADPTDVSAIVVSWNVRLLLERCLASLEAAWAHEPRLSHETIVFDNASRDGSAEMVRRLFPDARLIANECNIGYAAALNHAMTIARGRDLLLLNSDTEVAPDAPALMCRYLDDHPSVAVVGPQLVNTDGSLQSSRRRFPTLASGLIESTVLQRLLPRSPLLRRYYADDLLPGKPQAVDWLVGACLAVRAEAAHQVGGLDQGYFMYLEEVDWCLRFKGAGWQIVHLPEATVVHHYGRSSEQDVLQRHLRFNRSKVRYYRKHHGRVAAELVRLFLLANFAVLIAEDGIKLTLGHKRPFRRRRMAQLLAVLSSGLRP